MIVKKPWPYQFKMQKIIIRSVAESFFLDPPFEKKKNLQHSGHAALFFSGYSAVVGDIFETFAKYNGMQI
jgi:hypothetical protein